MKRIATLLLALVTMLTLAACGGEAANNENNTTNNATNNTNQPTSSQEETAKVDDDDKIENEIAFDELLVVDNDECTIKIIGIDPDDTWGYTLKALLENKSADKTYMFSIEDAAINGVQCDPSFGAKVAAGKKSNEDISFRVDRLEENGITEYTDIELTFRVFDSNDWSADEVARETIHVYPYGEDKAVKFVREAQPSDNVMIDNEYVTAIVTGYEEDGTFGYTVNLFLVNKTDKNVMFSVDEASVNGFMADPSYATSVPAGKCAFSSITWSDTTLEENDITEVETIEFIFTAYDKDNWSSDDFANETITLNP